MAGSFSARLAELRKKKGISQKQAASALGISQALLSHYEKGIRECSLDFVKKAAKYYDVTCDYLLGMSNSKKSIGVDFDEGDNPQDSELTISTIYRAASMLEKMLSKKFKVLRWTFSIASSPYFTQGSTRHASASRPAF